MTKPPRILLVSFIDNSRSSGMGRWSHLMAGGLERLGHSVTLWFADDFPAMKRAGRLSVLLFPVALALRLWRRRRDFDAVLIHEPSGFWYGVLRRLAPSLPPMVVMCHNVESRTFFALREAARRGLAFVPRGTRIKTPLLRLWQSDGAIRLADHVVCLSSVDREYLISRLGREPKRVTMKINGAAAENFQARSSVSGGGKILFVGGWLDVKGRRLLPPLWREVRSKFPQARLTIVGSGAGAESVLADFDEADRASVTVIPRVFDEREMARLYSAHDLFLMPSLSEGSPLALLEAMASGLPVVAARVGGVPDIVTHEVNGLLFDATCPSEGAQLAYSLLSETALAARLGAAARERARLLTWTAAAEAVAGAVNSALLSRARSNTVTQSRGHLGGEIQTKQVIED